MVSILTGGYVQKSWANFSLHTASVHPAVKGTWYRTYWGGQTLRESVEYVHRYQTINLHFYLTFLPLHLQLSVNICVYCPKLVLQQMCLFFLLQISTVFNKTIFRFLLSSKNVCQLPFTLLSFNKCLIGLLTRPSISTAVEEIVLTVRQILCPFTSA